MGDFKILLLTSSAAFNAFSVHYINPFPKPNPNVHVLLLILSLPTPIFPLQSPSCPAHRTFQADYRVKLTHSSTSKFNFRANSLHKATYAFFMHPVRVMLLETIIGPLSSCPCTFFFFLHHTSQYCLSRAFDASRECILMKCWNKGVIHVPVQLRCIC